MTLPSQDFLKECFSYNEKTGEFKFKERPKYHFASLSAWKSWNSKFSGKRTGSVAKIKNHEYILLTTNNKQYFAHRIAWKIVHGEDPNIIDHKNGNGTDNRISNLSNCDYRQNSMNCRLSRNNTSGVCGVYFCNKRRIWVAQIYIKGKTLKLGYYSSIVDAEKARKEASEYYGFSDRHGSY